MDSADNRVAHDRCGCRGQLDESTVTSKNAFDVELENEFQVKFQNGNPISLILDGTEYIK